MNEYRIIDKIGEGAHGVVLKATRISTGQIVALKKIPLRNVGETRGIPNNIIREIKTLQQLSHPNVVELLEVFPSGPGFSLVFELMVSDLSEILKYSSYPLSESQTKGYMVMLLRGLDYCHSCQIMHRDLKPANLLISSSRVLKLADFGLARICQRGDSTRPYSHQVATRWYRAPELLYGARKYDMGVDLWAVGCIFGELLNHSPLFPGQNDIDQLCSVISVLGSPTKESWPQLEDLPDYSKISFPHSKGISINEVCPDSSHQAITLLGKFLKYNSLDRISAKSALLDEYFFQPPLPAHHLELPSPEFVASQKKKNMFNTKEDLDMKLFTPSFTGPAVQAV